MREKIHYYKNTVLFCFVVILLFFLAGCANDTTNDSNANTVGQQTEAMAQELPVAEKNHAALWDRASGQPHQDICESGRL